MATKKLVVKNAVKNPKKGEFYYVKDGSVYATTPNRKGGKKGRKTCTASAPKKRIVKKKVVKKTATKKRVAKKAAPRKTTKRKTTKRK